MDLTLSVTGPIIYLVPRKEVMTFPAKWMVKEVGGGFRVGNTCTPMADSCQCMEKKHYSTVK